MDATPSSPRLSQASIIEFSPPEALQRGGTGVRLPVERLFAHPALAAFVRDSAATELLARLPKAGQSSVFHLSADGGFVERVKPTPEVRQLTQGVLHQRSWDRQEVKGCGVGGAASASPSDLSSPPPPPPQPHDFSVLSFNLLADMLCTCEMYPSIDTSTLDWAARLPLIQKEIAFRSPDLLCLQERHTPAPPCTPLHPLRPLAPIAPPRTPCNPPLSACRSCKVPPRVRACLLPTTITRCCGGGSTSTATMAGSGSSSSSSSSRLR